MPSRWMWAWRVAAQLGMATEISSVGGVIENFDIEDGSEMAKALRADAELVDLVVELDAKLLNLA